MIKRLAIISEKDKDRGLALTAIIETYTTLSLIEDYDINKSELAEKIKNAQKELSLFWYNLSERYMFPFYLDKTMKINYEDNTVYIEE